MLMLIMIMIVDGLGAGLDKVISNISPAEGVVCSLYE